MLWQPVSEIFDVVRKLSEGRTKFWGVKFLWRRERRYVAIQNMEVWKRLARLAPDVPDGWSFPDVQVLEVDAGYKIRYDEVAESDHVEVNKGRKM